MIKHESNAAYHASAPYSRSRLWRIIEKNPQYFKYCESHPPAKTPAMLLGSVFHKLVLEPSDFGSEYAIAPELDRRTREGRAAYEAFMDANSGKTAVPCEMYAQAKEMADAVAHDSLAAFLCGGAVEESYYFTDDMTGLACKVRPDSFREVNGRGLIVDLKSCMSASTEDFMRHAVKMGYDMQAAMYKTGVEAVRGIECDFVFVAVEKEPPYLINILRADDAMLKRGYDLYRECLGTVKHCRDTGVWYGYTGESHTINELSLPKWLAEQYD